MHIQLTQMTPLFLVNFHLWMPLNFLSNLDRAMYFTIFFPPFLASTLDISANT